jgi:Flp pilus assembly pilin Flp
LNSPARLAFKLLYTPFILRNTKHNQLQRDDLQAPSLATCFLFDVPERTRTMTNLLTNLIHDEAGFIVSAELVLVATIAVLAMIVGLSEVALNVNNELEDVGSAFGSINQTFVVQGIKGHQGYISGTEFRDNIDYCDNTCDVQGIAGRGEYSE